MSENFEKNLMPEQQPEQQTESILPTGKIELNVPNVEEELSQGLVERITKFAKDEETVKFFIEAGFSKDEKSAKFSKDKACEILGQNYEFSNWPQFFSDLQIKLEGAGDEEKEIRNFQQKIHKAWISVLETQPKSELDGMDFLMNKKQPFVDMPSLPGPSRDAFYPIIVESLRRSPHLGIYDEKDLDEIAKRVFTFKPKNKVSLTPDVIEMLVVGNIVGKMLENKGEPELFNRKYLPQDFEEIPKVYKKFVKEDTKK